MRKVIGGLPLFFVIVFFCKSAVDPRQDESSLDQAKLKEILQKTSEYCRKLESAVFNFVCLEEIEEKVKNVQGSRQDLVPDRRAEGGIPQTPRNIPHYELTGRTEENKYLYEYQLVRKKGRNEEIRTLLKKNGRKKIQQDAKLEAGRLQYENMAFGPIDLLSRRSQFYHDYKIVKEEVLNQEKVAIIEAAPNPSSPQHSTFGKIWVRESDFVILKILWNEKSINNLQYAEERAAQLKAKPQITLISEFDIEKNGIRFPSRVIFEEAHINRQGKKLVASEITVTYKDYKFFRVEVDVKY